MGAETVREVNSVPSSVGELFIHHHLPETFFHTASVFSCTASSMEGKFEEVDDAFLDEWADMPEMIKEVQDCSFAKIYGPIRALFATESVVLSKFEDCLDHMERLDFLLKMEVRLTWHCRNLCKACFNGKIG